MHTLTQMVQTRPLLNFHSHVHPVFPQTPWTQRLCKVKLQTFSACRLWHFHCNKQGRLSGRKWRVLILNYTVCVSFGALKMSVPLLPNSTSLCLSQNQLHPAEKKDQSTHRRICRWRSRLHVNIAEAQTQTGRVILINCCIRWLLRLQLGVIWVSKQRIFWPLYQARRAGFSVQLANHHRNWPLFKAACFAAAASSTRNCNHISFFPRPARSRLSSDRFRRCWI